jgi:hypothetical protein
LPKPLICLNVVPEFGEVGLAPRERAVAEGRGARRSPSPGRENARAFVSSGSPYIRWNRETLDRSGRDTMETASMSLLTSSIESTRLTRWNFGLGALTLLGVFAIALALILPDSITP